MNTIAKHIALPAAALALSFAALAGCSKSDNTATTATTSAQASSGDKATTSEKSSTSAKGATTSTNAKKGDSSTSISLPGDLNVPGGGDLDKTLNQAQKCVDMATGYSGLFTPLIGGQVSNADKEKIQTALEDMKANVPSNIANDIDTIESGIKNAGSLTEVGQFMSSDTFTKANDEITNYLTTECNKVK